MRKEEPDVMLLALLFVAGLALYVALTLGDERTRELLFRRWPL